MKTHLANSRLSKKPSRKQHATRKRLTLAVIALLALAFAGFPALRRAEFARRVGAQNPTFAPASTLFVVNSTDDGDDAATGNGVCETAPGNGQCTLRAAIEETNTEVGDDGIRFNIAGCPGGACTINLTKVLPDITDGVFITGPGVDKLTVRRDTGGSYPIFTVPTSFSNPKVVTLSGLTISNGSGLGGIVNRNNGTLNVSHCTISGNSAGQGGGIYNDLFNGGTLNVTNSTISGNRASQGAGIYSLRNGTINVTNSTISGNTDFSSGGVIFNGATLNVTNSTISDNQGTGIGNGGTLKLTSSMIIGNSGGDRGGGISNAGTLEIINTTISDNRGADLGGGIFNYDTGHLKLTNSTISGNIAREGGGIFNNGSLQLSNSTISGNRAESGFGGGAVTLGSLMDVKSSIIALNTGPVGSTNPDVYGAFNSAGFNLIGQADASNGFTQPTDQTGTIASPLDPKLDPAGLQDNGGPTQTIALMPDSPAVDKGTSIDLTGTTLTTDQRGTGFPRTFNDPNVPNASGGDGTDIGAFEKQTITPTLQFSSATYSVNENAGTATITVTRANDTSVAATVNFATSNGTATAGSDYTATSGTLSFASGDTSKTFSIPIINDSLNEPNETINLTLSNVMGNAALGTPSTAVLTIVDDDPLPGLSINDVSVTEGNSGTTSANFTVSLSTASSQTVTANYGTANGTATAGSDYVATTGTLTFTPGQTTKTISVTVNGDTTVEPDETFFVNLSSPTNATITRSRGTGTITNDDAAPTIQFSSSTYSVNENAGAITITVTRTGDTSVATTVNYAAMNGTATAGSDYTATSGTLSFASGDTSKTFSIPIINDSLNEPNETVNLTLSNVTGNAVLGTPTTSVLTIIDDDPLPGLSINDVSVQEGNSGTTNANFTVSLSAPSGQTVTVNYATANGTATAGSDYQSTSGTLTFNPGDTSKPIAVLVNGDTANEPNETFFVNLSAATNATIADNQGLGTITNDDPVPSLSINDVGVAEGSSGTTNATFNVTLSIANWQTVTVNFATANGTATAGSDYVAASGTLTFSPGQTIKPITVTVNGDTTNEPDETFFVNLSSATNATIARSKGTGTILNDDGATLILLIEEGTLNQAAALDSVTQTRGPFSKTDLFNFSSDQRTRVILFTTSLGQNNSTGLTVQIGGVSVPIENVAPVPGQPQFSQIVVRLDPSVPTGTLNVTVTLNGVTSNTTTMDIIP